MTSLVVCNPHIDIQSTSSVYHCGFGNDIRITQPQFVMGRGRAGCPQRANWICTFSHRDCT